MAGLTPYAYRAGATALHRLGAGWKLAGVCAFSFCAFFLGLPGLVASSAVVLAAASAAKLSPSALFSGSQALAITTAFVVALQAFGIDSAAPFFLKLDLGGLRDGLLFAWGVFVSFAAGSILFATTTTGELRRSLSRAEKAVKAFFSRVLPKGAYRSAARIDLSLTVALALAFIPRVFAVWEAARDAHLARCGGAGVRATLSIVPLAAERLIEAAAETAAAMTGRGYTGGMD